ncbi:MAG: prephenate dehydrogenase/arogenate dehydrogenase family protein [Planctomycetota bacterium]
MAVCKRLVVVGVGLIGGSIALAAKRHGAASEVVGVVRSQASLERAGACGVADELTTDLPAAVAEADLILACTPVGQVAETLLSAAAACPESAILTDAGSTKAGIVAEVEQGLAASNASPTFVGCHPLAGNHQTGPESARADLLEDRVVVVAPTNATPAPTIDLVTRFWQAIGATVVKMSPAEHDASLARTSHLPHVIAAALAAATPEETLRLAGTGWRDTTRIAAGDAALWRDILTANRAEVLAALDSFDQQLAAFRTALATGDDDGLQQLLNQGRQRRDAVGD